MKSYDKIIISLFLLVSFIVFYNIVVAYLSIWLERPLNIDIAGGFIHYIFYIGAAFTPIYFLIRGLILKSKTHLFWMGISLIPSILFSVWFIFVLRELAEILSNF
jgi:hypothetical protein